MFGSGKTWFGSCFLEKLKESKELHKDLINEYGKNAVSSLLGSSYVYIDFRQWKKFNPGILSILNEADLEIVLRRMLANWLPEEQRKTLYGKLVKNYTSESIFKLFGNNVFVHLDEFGEIFSSDENSKLIDRYYELWKILNEWMREGHFCYVTGRDHELVYIGYQFSTYTSPGIAQNIVLDSLKIEHVKKLMPNGHKINDEEIKDFLEKSGGVPRFISYFVEIVKKNINEDYNLVYKQFEKYIIEKQIMNKIFLKQSDFHRKKYLEWIAFSQFNIAFDPFVEVRRSDWIFKNQISNNKNNKNEEKEKEEESNEKDFTVLFTILEHFNLYLKKGPEEKVFINFPQIVIQYARDTLKLELDLWLTKGPFSLQSGSTLESVANNCVFFRLSYGTKLKLTIGDLFSFLKKK